MPSSKLLAEDVHISTATNTSDVTARQWNDFINFY